MSTITPPRPQGTADWPAQAVAYLAEVDAALQGIDPEERDDLLDELGAHIDALLEVEAAANGDAAHISLVRQLGPAREFATELIESAGLARPSQRPGLVERLSTRLRGWLSDTRIRTARQWLRQLAPAWWVLRGYGLAIGLSAVFDGSGQYVPVPSLGSRFFGLIATAGLIYASVEVGAGRRRISGRVGKLLLIGASGLAVLMLMFGLNPGSDIEDDIYYEPIAVVETDALTLPGGEPITNIYAFDRDGNPLEDILLYDGVGNPIVLQRTVDGRAYPFDTFGVETDYGRDANGRIIPNMFPLTQYRTGDDIVEPALRGELAPGDLVAPLVEEPRTPVDPGATLDDSGTRRRPAPEVRIPPARDDAVDGGEDPLDRGNDATVGAEAAPRPDDVTEPAADPATGSAPG